MTLDELLHLKSAVLGMSFTEAWWQDFNGRQILGDGVEDLAALDYVKRMRDERRAKAQVVYRCMKDGCLLLEALIVPNGVACRLGSTRSGRQGPGKPVRFPRRGLFITAYDLDIARRITADEQDPVGREAGIRLWCDHQSRRLPFGWLLEDLEKGKRMPTRRLVPLETQADDS